MIPLYQDDGFTFRFAEHRIIPRFHLDGARVREMQVRVVQDRHRHRGEVGASDHGICWQWWLGGLE